MPIDGSWTVGDLDCLSLPQVCDAIKMGKSYSPSRVSEINDALNDALKALSGYGDFTDDSITHLQYGYVLRCYFMGLVAGGHPWLINFDCREKRGYIYMLRRDDGIYKIGETRSLKNRMKQYNSSYELVWSVKSTDALRGERVLICFYAKYIVEGREYLALPDSAVTDIKSLPDMTPERINGLCLFLQRRLLWKILLNEPVKLPPYTNTKLIFN